jgi:transposase, IS30 family
LALEHGRTIISHESIYRFIYWRLHSFKEPYYKLLPRQHYKRRHRGYSLKRAGKSLILGRVSIHQRPNLINTRQQLGHWEVDMMSFAKQSQACLVMVERQSRYLILQRHNTTKAQPTIQALNTIFADLPVPLRQSATFDNGTEFYQHYQLTTNLNMSTYFCDPHCPWQKGTVENTIKRLAPLPAKQN